MDSCDIYVLSDEGELFSLCFQELNHKSRVLGMNSRNTAVHVKSQIRDEVLYAGFAGDMCLDSHAEQSTHVTCAVKSLEPTWASTAQRGSESLRIYVEFLVIQCLETFHCCQTCCELWRSIWQHFIGSCDPRFRDLLRLVSLP